MSFSAVENNCRLSQCLQDISEAAAEEIKSLYGVYRSYSCDLTWVSLREENYFVTQRGSYRTKQVHWLISHIRYKTHSTSSGYLIGVIPHENLGRSHIKSGGLEHNPP